MFNWSRLFLLLALLLSNSNTLALDISGFGTLGATYNDSTEAAFIRDISQLKGVKDGWSARTDSRLGIQLDQGISSEFSTTAQVVTKYNTRNNFDPALTLAFVKYQPDPTLNIRLGRLGWDIFPFSDSRDVGYSYNWVRPPPETFSKLQFNSLDGMDLSIARRGGDALLTTKVFAGISTDRLALTSENHNSNNTRVWGVNLDVQLRDWEYRLSYSHLDLGITYHGAAGAYLKSLYASPDPALNQLADIIDVDGANVDIYAISGSYNRGPLTVRVLLGQTETDSPVGPTNTNGLLSASYRFDRIRPFAYYAFTRPEQSASMGSPYNYTEHQHSLTAGVRYDVLENAAAKFQVSRVSVAREGHSGLFWRDIEPNWDGKAVLVSLSLDFFF